MKPILIGIAGGSGAGKSTLCTALMDLYPETIGMVQLDDYFRPAADVPKLAGMDNWDHPDALFLDRLGEDLERLSQGESVMIRTKNLRLNPDYVHTNTRIHVQFDPKPVMLVEGYLVLHDPRIREALHTSIWLDVPHSSRWERRVHFKNPEYEERVALPMHAQFAEPTKRHAKHVLDVTTLRKEEVLDQVREIVLTYVSTL